MVLGGHGDTMVPLISYTSVSGIPVTQLHRPGASSTRSSIAPGTAAPRSSSFLKTGSAYYAPSAARGADGRGDRARPEADPAVRRVARRASTACRDVFLGVPCKLGRERAWSRSIEVELTDRGARGARRKCAEAVREQRWSTRVRHSADEPARRCSGESTVGKKMVMAVTGLILVGFVIAHMAGNLQVFHGPDQINALRPPCCTAPLAGALGRAARAARRRWCCT